MMTSSNGNIFRVTGPLWGEFPGPGEFPTQRAVTRSFDVFFDLRLNKRLSKQPWGWWFETPSWSLWRHCNELIATTTWWLVNHTDHYKWWRHGMQTLSASLALCEGNPPVISISHAKDQQTLGATFDVRLDKLLDDKHSRAGDLRRHDVTSMWRRSRDVIGFVVPFVCSLLINEHGSDNTDFQIIIFQMSYYANSNVPTAYPS